MPTNRSKSHQNTARHRWRPPQPAERSPVAVDQHTSLVRDGASRPRVAIDLFSLSNRTGAAGSRLWRSSSRCGREAFRCAPSASVQCHQRESEGSADSYVGIDQRLDSFHVRVHRLALSGLPSPESAIVHSQHTRHLVAGYSMYAPVGPQPLRQGLAPLKRDVSQKLDDRRNRPEGLEGCPTIRRARCTRV